jgi:antitoxin YefM
MLQTTYTKARQNFAGLCDEISDNREIVIVHRRKGNNIAMIAADELKSIIETAHLMRSPKNAERLLSALEKALKRQGIQKSIKMLRKDMNLGE